jgi:8-amino-7-oxononanoate synthase
VGRLRDRIEEHRDELDLQRTARSMDFFPYFRPVEAETGPTATMEGRERIMLGSNNYLGLAGDARVKQAARDALDRYGTGMTGSRLLNGTMPLHGELEAEIAAFMQTEDALVFTTGYQANVGSLGALVGRGDAVVCDSADHASILDGVAVSGAQLVPFRHGRLDRLERALHRVRETAKHLVVVVDGVYSMEGGVADLPGILALCDESDADLIVDEAHAIGPMGARGAGTCELFGVEERVALRTGTFSKSLASCGGFVAGPADLLEYLRTNARAFVFSAAAVPAAVGAALAALRILRSPEGPERGERSVEAAVALRAGLVEAGFKLVEAPGPEIVTPIVSVAVGDEIRAMCLWRALYDEGVYVNVSVYPAVPRGGALLRASTMATHEQHHIERALAAFAAVRDEAEAGFFTELA